LTKDDSRFFELRPQSQQIGSDQWPPISSWNEHSTCVP
jgi:hypothetical protein